MPNHVTNILTINAEGDKLKEILTAIKGEDRALDFNRIIPMPESLNIESSSRGVDAEEYIASKTKCAAKQTPKDKVIIEKFELRYKGEIFGEALRLGLTYIHNRKSYGYTTWYDWSCNHWGTKWNAYDIHAEENTVTFDTAWCSPAPVFEELSRMFPDVEFVVVYADEDAGYNTGTGYFMNGEEHMHYPEGGSNEAYELYFQTHEGAKDEMYMGDDGKYHWKED